MSDLLITVDTEADDEWTWRQDASTLNGRCLPQLQESCDSLGVPVVYLVTWDMLQDPSIASFLRSVVDAGTAEVGAHLHTWRTPPFDERFDRSLAYAHELPQELVAEKLATLTKAIGDAVGLAPRSYRAGRYGLASSHIALLENEGYLVDSSVTPWTTWQYYEGLPGGPGGANFVDAPERPYHPHPANLAIPGSSRILEVPLSIRMVGFAPRTVKKQLARRRSDDFAVRVASKVGASRREELRPAIYSKAELNAAVRRQLRSGEPVLNTLLHSSELLAGASPYTRSEEEVTQYFDRLESMIRTALEEGAVGSTFAQVEESWSNDA